MMANELVITGSQSFIPVQVAAAGEQAAIRFIEFFTANIRNPNTRAAYARAVSEFFRWCDGIGLHRLDGVEPVHVAAYVEELGKTRAAPSVKQHLLTGWWSARWSAQTLPRAQARYQAGQDAGAVAGGGA